VFKIVLLIDYNNCCIKAEQVITDEAAIFPIYQKGSAFLLKSNVTVQKSINDLPLWWTADVN